MRFWRTNSANRPVRRRSRLRRRRTFPLVIACLAAAGVFYGMAGLRGLVLLSGLTLVTLLVRSWVRGRRLARTLERLLELSPEEFETLSQRLLQRMGYAVRRVGGTGDGGIDLAGESDGETVLVQCKRYRGSVGSAQVRDFYGALSKAQAARGYFITTGAFTGAARAWSQDVAIPLELVDGVALVELVGKHLAPDVLPHFERTRVRLMLVVALLLVTGVAAYLAPDPDAELAAYLALPLIRDVIPPLTGR